MNSVELIYYVNQNDQPTGETPEKLAAHNADTKLHAAFSCYVFNKQGKFLVTQRARTKKVWPSVWTNSVCGHPAPNETRENAIKRRLHEELGMSAENITCVVPDYIYKTPPYNGIIEHEYCPIFIATTDQEPQANGDEVGDYKWVDWQWYVDQLQNDPVDYSAFAEKAPKSFSSDMPKWSWWCKDQLKHIQKSQEFLNFISSAF